MWREAKKQYARTSLPFLFVKILWNSMAFPRTFFSCRSARNFFTSSSDKTDLGGIRSDGGANANGIIFESEVPSKNRSVKVTSVGSEGAVPNSTPVQPSA